MDFKTEVSVQGNFIKGKIENDEFKLGYLTSKERKLPPLQTTHLFNSNELGELISELQMVKNKLDGKLEQPTKR